MIFLLIALLLLLYALKNFRKAVLWCLVYKLILVQNITVISLPGIPLLTVSTLLLLGLLFIYFYNRSSLKLDKREFPYIQPMKILVSSMVLSTVFSAVGFGTALSAFLLDFLDNVFLSFLIWKCVISNEDIIFLLKAFTICFLIFGIYDIYEHFVETNMWADWISTFNTDENRNINYIYNGNDGRGYRAKSIFEHAIGAGVNFGLYISLILSLLVHFKFKVPYQKLSYIVMVLALMSVFFSASRGPLVFLIISLLSFVNFKSYKSYVFVAMTFFAVLIVFPYISQYADVLKSIFSTEAQSKVGGSNADMRVDQLTSAWHIMKRAPLFGMGYKFQSVLSNALTADLLGMESIWFRILTQFGVMGIVANVYYAYYSIVVISRKYNSGTIFFISCAYWITSTLTSTPGMLMYLYFIVLIIVIKLSMEQEQHSSSKKIVLPKLFQSYHNF